MSIIASLNPAHLLIVMKYQSKTATFLPFRFMEAVTAGVTPMEWWQVIGNLEPSFLSYVTQLMTAINSSASIERVFSTFGLVYSKLRNRLGIEKAGKLVFIYCSVNTTSICDIDN